MPALGRRRALGVAPRRERAAGSRGGPERAGRCHHGGVPLHPAENRGYRELYAYARQLCDHWSALAARLPGTDAAGVLVKGSESARELISELKPATEAHGLHGQPAAQGVGRSLARQRDGQRDRFLERNQALRFAVEDMQHVTTLLAYLGALADTRGDADLSDLCGRWERKLRRTESAMRKAAVAGGSDPDAAIEPLDGSAAGRAAHTVGYAVGTVGEWFDRWAAGKLVR
jgi:hypothetical protein